MCSIFHRLSLNQMKTHLTGSYLETSNNVMRNSIDNQNEWCTSFDLFARVIAYIAMLVLITLILLMILKYLMGLNNNEERARLSVTEPLISSRKTAMLFTYGTCDTDLEAGNCSCSTHGNHEEVTSLEEPYDSKLCIICYDELRNCFIVPCGHCATCYVCAKRIFAGENKVCPVCRRLIGKVRKLFAS